MISQAVGATGGLQGRQAATNRFACDAEHSCNALLKTIAT
jgi:hypothetical protein